MATAISVTIAIIGVGIIGVGAVLNAVRLNRQKHAHEAARSRDAHAIEHPSGRLVT